MSEWREVKLGEVLTLSQGLAINKQSKHLQTEDNNEIPLLRIADLIEKTKTRYIKREVPDRFIAHPDELIYTRTGRVGLVFKNRYGVVHNNCFKIKPNEEIVDKDFLYWLLSTKFIYSHVNSIATGAAQPDLTHSKFKSIKVLIPDLEKQKKISYILSTYDKLIENNNRRIQILEQTAEELYKEWFVRMRFPGYEKTKFDKGIPEGWRIENIKNTVPVLTGKKDANYADENGQYMFFTCSQEPSRSKGYSFDSHSILLAGNGDFNVKLYKGKFEAYQRTYVLTPYNHCHLYLIYFKLKNDIERLISQAAGSVIRYLTKGMIERINFFVPNELLLNEFNKYVEDIYRASDLIIKQNENLIKQRDLLLPRLMNGTITIK